MFISDATNSYFHRREMALPNICHHKIRLASRTFFNETSQISERYSAQMQAITSEKN